MFEQASIEDSWEEDEEDRTHVAELALLLDPDRADSVEPSADERAHDLEMMRRAGEYMNFVWGGEG